MFNSRSEEEADQVLICDFAHFHLLNVPLWSVSILLCDVTSYTLATERGEGNVYSAVFLRAGVG